MNSSTVLAQQANIDIYELMQRTDLTLSNIEQQATIYFDRVGTGKGTGHNQYQRWLYEQKFHLKSDGHFISLEDESKAYELATVSMQAPKSSHRAAWIELGPNNWNYTSGWNPGVGRVRGVAVHPSNTNKIFAASDGGGIWRTTNGGTSWSPMITNQNAAWMKTYDVEIAPSNQNYVYACLRPGGVIKSTNGGTTWSATSSGPSSAKKVLIHPSAPNTVLVAATNGIWRSTNGGSSWTLEQSGNFEDIEFKPNNTNYVYACGSTIYCRSTNNGQSWTTITSGLVGSGRRMLAVSPANGSYVYMVQASGNIFGRLYRSTNNGASWTTRVTGSATSNNYFGYNTNGVDSRGQAGHDMAICVNRTNINEVHIAGIICWKSTNGGTSFTAETVWSYPNSTGYNHADVHGLEWVNNTIYSCSDGGIYKSTNNGGDWTDLSSGLGVRQFYRISNSKTSANVVCGGAQDNGTSMRQSSGQWFDWLGADGMDCIISPTNANYAIGTSQFGSIYKTTNGGSSRSNLSKPNSGNWVTPLASHPTIQNTVYGGWQGVYKSTNYGSSWTKISGTTIPSGQKLNCLAVAPSNANYIYASRSSTLYRTTNDGSSWSTYSSGGGTISSIAVSATNPNKVYITTTSSSNNVKVSTNGGSSWTTISSGLPTIAARSIAVDDDANETLFVGMNIGVYTRNNSNTAWTQAATGLPLVAINEVEIQQSSNKLRVATYGRGLWETSITNTVACNPPSVRWVNSITTNSAKTNWSASASATYYQVRYRVNGTSAWSYASWTTGTNRVLTGLTTGTTYNWQIRPYCSGIFGSFSSTLNFTTTTSCSTPTYCFSSFYSTSPGSTKVYWGSSTGAQNYRLEKQKSGSSTWSLVASAATGTNLVVNGLAAGKWRFRVRANCGSGNYSAYKISGYRAIHCASKGNTSYYLHIDYAKLQTMTRSSGDDGGYYNAISSVASVKPGNSYWFTYSGGFGSATYPAYWRLFIDYNHDGDFTDAGEIAWSAYTTGSGNYMRNFTVPTSATTGYTRMRLSMKYGSYPTACQTFGHGEVEDYGLNISNSAPTSEGEGNGQTVDDIKTGSEILSIFPNPVKDEIHFSYNLIEENSNVGVSVTTANGQVIIKKKISGVPGRNNGILDVHELASGVYFLKVNTAVGKETMKFTVY
jgi:hypothetical protein